jgi:hypothetical protein
VAGLVEFLILARNHLRLGLRWRARYFATFPCGRARPGTARRLRTPRRHDLDLRKRSNATSRRG